MLGHKERVTYRMVQEASNGNQACPQLSIRELDFHAI